MSEPIIRVANVTRTYHVGDVDVHALRGMNLIVEPGEFIAIMGSSGREVHVDVIARLPGPTVQR
jgi:ABC-type glutathione transport system ATPase component